MTAQPVEVAAAPRYLPGGWVAVVHGGTWLFAATQPNAQVVERCWRAVRGGADPDQVVSEILRDGFRAVPDFALVKAGADVTSIVVRGTAVVDMALADGTRSTADAGGTSSLIERAVTGVPAGFRLRGPELAGVGVDVAHMLPLESGVVLASVLEFGTFDVDAAGGGVSDEQPVPPESVATQVIEAVANRASSVSVSVPASASVSASVSGDSGEQVPDLDYIFQATVVRDSRPGEPLTGPPASTRLLDDGMGWMSGQEHVAQLTGRPVIENFDLSTDLGGGDPEATVFRPATRPGMADQPVVLAARCAAGHLNDPAAVACRVCRERVPEQQAMLVPRPSLGRLRLSNSNGEPLALDRGVIFGRNPVIPEGYAGPRPSLIRLSSADDISRNHVEIRLDGWRVLVVDLGSRNGTELTRPDDQTGTAFALQPLQEYELESGAVISLAPDVWIAYEVTS